MDVMFGVPGVMRSPVKTADVPEDVATVNVLAPSGASGATVIVIGKLESVPPLKIAAVTPVPLNVTVALVRFLPLIVAASVKPWAADVMLSERTCGMAVGLTVKEPEG